MKKFIALVVMLCVVLVSSTASAADWVWVLSDEDSTVYVDNNSIRRDYNYRGYVFRAFIKWVYSDAGRNKMIEGWRSSGISLPREIYNLSHDIKFFYFKEENGINCFDILSSVSYDRDGNTIPEMSFSYSELQWRIIPPDTIVERMFDVIRARVPN